MWGAGGTMRRQRVILGEFVLGALGCAALGAWILVGASGIWIVVGIWLIGAGLNYVPLAAHAWSLSRPGALERSPRLDLRRASVQQLWIAVPFAVAIASGINRAPAR